MPLPPCSRDTNCGQLAADSRASCAGSTGQQPINLQSTHDSWSECNLRQAG